MSIPGHNNISC